MALPFVCRQCGHAGRPKRKTNGSVIVEVARCVWMISRGLSGSLWCLTLRAEVCLACSGRRCFLP
jgi:hypothetical protein